MQFEWDEKKNEANMAKHGYRLLEGITVWADKGHVEFIDDRFDYGEMRKITVGKYDGRLISVCWTQRKRKIRLISVRPAGRKEKELYDGSSNNDVKTGFSKHNR
ncbi:MAG: BrnT family toxin [Spirochaetaceae bacterium]|nr:BrnT family toxin [Spirochaetaceae bacterium]